MHIFKHFRTITKHRHKVMKYCFKCGLYRQGLAHDLSKYGRIEFNNGAKYYLGTKSPHHAERLDKGFSEAWMHHKGRNKHHCEYWIDFNMETKKYEPVEMPNRYIAESLCDRIAASEIYNGKNYKITDPLDYFNRENGINIPMHENTKKIMRYLLTMYANEGPKKTFKFIKKNMRNNRRGLCLEEKSK